MLPRPPHRDSSFVDRCDSCEEVATSSCPRCQRPACDEHGTGPDRLCAPCETEYERQTTGLLDGKPIDRKRYAWSRWCARVARRTLRLLATATAVVAAVLVRVPIFHPDLLVLALVLLALLSTPLLLLALLLGASTALGGIRDRQRRRRFVRGSQGTRISCTGGGPRFMR